MNKTTKMETKERMYSRLPLLGEVLGANGSIAVTGLNGIGTTCLNGAGGAAQCVAAVNICRGENGGLTPIRRESTEEDPNDILLARVEIATENGGSAGTSGGNDTGNSEGNSAETSSENGEQGTGNAVTVRESVELRLVEGRRIWAKGPEGEYAVGTISGSYRSTLVVSPSLVVVMTSYGAERIEVTSEGTCRLQPHGELLPPLRFETYGTMRLTAPIEARTLKGTYTSRSEELNEADTATLTGDLVNAYKRLGAYAHSAGFCFQPMLARYRYEDSEGRELYCSSPVMVMAESGVQCANEFSIRLAQGGESREAATVYADVYRLRISTANSYNGAAPTGVARLIVETSTPIHPVDFEGTAATAVDSDGGSGAIVRCFMPGASTGMVRAKRLLRERVEGVANHGDEAFTTAMVVNNPFAEGSSIEVDVIPRILATQSVAAQVKQLMSMAANEPAREDYLTALCRMPNRFSAATGCRVGDSIVWGNITAGRAEPGRAEQYAVGLSEDAEAWRSSVVVEFANGEERVVQSIGYGEGAPTLFSPFLSYPAPDATRMRILMKVGERNYCSSFELSRSADGLSAYYISPGLAPIELEETAEEFEYATAVKVERTIREGVVTCTVGNPLTPIDSTRAAQGAVVAVKGVDRRGGSWDYSMRRFYLFTTGGLLMGNLDKVGMVATVHPFDNRPIASAAAVVETTLDQYPIVYIGGEDLIALSRSAVKTVAVSTAGFAFGGGRVDWDASTRTLIAATSAGALRAFPAIPMSTAYDVEPGAGFVYEVALECPTGTKSLVPLRLRGLGVDLTATALEGELSVWADTGRSRAKVVSHRISGEVATGAALRVVAPPVRRVIVDLRGEISGATALGGMRAEFGRL